jgi:putative membrane protein
MYRKIITFAAALLFAGTMSVAQSNAPAGENSGAHAHHKASKGDKGATSAGAAESGSKMSKKDEMFMMKAAQGGKAEVELGQLAKDKASNDQVKQFAQRMVDDHGKAGDELQSLASKKGVTLPTDTDKKEQAEKDRLSKLSGAEFDKAYMEHMLQDHKKDVAEFKRESQMAKDSDLKDWASKTTPTLEDHLKQAESTASAVGVSGAKTTASNSGKKGRKSKATSPSGQ